jgi:hypothetical protein
LKLKGKIISRGKQSDFVGRKDKRYSHAEAAENAERERKRASSRGSAERVLGNPAYENAVGSKSSPLSKVAPPSSFCVKTYKPAFSAYRPSSSFTTRAPIPPSMRRVYWVTWVVNTMTQRTQ